MRMHAPGPTAITPERSLGALAAALAEPGPTRVAVLRAGDDELLELPAEVTTLLQRIVEALAEGREVTVAPADRRLTTQQAADLLGVSRPTLVKLLEAGEIPFERPGGHRRVRLADVLAHRRRAEAHRRAALDELVAVTEDSGMYEEDPAPRRTR